MPRYSDEGWRREESKKCDIALRTGRREGRRLNRTSLYQILVRRWGRSSERETSRPWKNGRLRERVEKGDTIAELWSRIPQKILARKKKDGEIIFAYPRKAVGIILLAKGDPPLLSQTKNLVASESGKALDRQRRWGIDQDQRSRRGTQGRKLIPLL